tara:strand:- start:1267 stop:1776 length:510 start_codon:yes stop_codon:yes gene_type:complete
VEHPEHGAGCVIKIKDDLQADALKVVVQFEKPDRYGKTEHHYGAHSLDKLKVTQTVSSDQDDIKRRSVAAIIKLRSVASHFGSALTAGRSASQDSSPGASPGGRAAVATTVALTWPTAEVLIATEAATAAAGSAAAGSAAAAAMEEATASASWAVAATAAAGSAAATIV